MYVDQCQYNQNGKSRVRTLLRTSYREGGKVKHQTIGNISQCSPQEIEAIRFALKHKNDLDALKKSVSLPVSTQQGLTVGSVFTLQQIAKRLGIATALGRTQQGRLALWLILARIIDQGSRLSAVRLARQHAACDLIGMDSFDEEDLYATLDWLADQQETIEGRLFRWKQKEHTPHLFLYDITSSYFEGQQNELAEYGYNRDNKNGKKQIVIGLLTDEEGDPVSVQVYRGNTSDCTTVLDQVQKVKERFGVQSVTLVGDRGMIKRTQIERLPETFHYVTALTKPQIRTMLKKDVLQMELFDEEVCEVEWDGVRYILRRNPTRADEMASQREEKQKNLQTLVDRQNEYLHSHARASVEKARDRVVKRLQKLKLEKWISVQTDSRIFRLQIDEDALAEIARLDGCYVIKTDTPAAKASSQQIHNRYKDLAQVEHAFRTMKTGFLETRPHYVRKEKRTRGHVFAVMLAYKIVRYLSEGWKALDCKVEEGVKELNSICATDVLLGEVKYQSVPRPRPMGNDLLQAIQVTLPDAIPSRGVQVDTRKKLTPRK